MLFLAAYRMIAPTSLVLWILVNGKDYGLEYVQKKAGPFLTLPHYYHSGVTKGRFLWLCSLLSKTLVDQNPDFHPAVLLATCCRLLIADSFRLAVAHGYRYAAQRNVVLHRQVLHH
jgi:hypothetical protein